MPSNHRCIHAEPGTFSHVCDRPAVAYTMSDRFDDLRIYHCAEHAPYGATPLPELERLPDAGPLFAPAEGKQEELF